ncbi:hypothetical protein DZF91_36915 [Actinomadura logoneensis]|uniref:Uncharacterized protein n=1 Tax=Actinomadura logoneensis TaxID=2293572 RepID=A0A372J9K3_9ACTN|nr:TniQ family protein [Actinomadura logoneensis]RFU36667.1 hypothetical protein DZF91_36915 [Actinomadura logoneensis]
MMPSPSPLPRRLPIAPPPARHEILASHLARLAALNGLDGDELWQRVTAPFPTLRRRTPDPDSLAALTGRPAWHLAGALLELRDPPPTWEAFRHHPADRLPTLRRPPPRRQGVPALSPPPLPLHPAPLLDRPTRLNKPGPFTEPGHELLKAQRQHPRLLRRRGWAATYDAVLTAFMICGARWGPRGKLDTDSTFVQQTIWDIRSYTLIPEGTERQTFSSSRGFAAIYPEAIELAPLVADPYWRKMAAGNGAELDLFLTQVRHRLRDPDYQPSPEADAVAHWIEQDCWRPPCPPPTTFAAAPGHRKPSQLNTPISSASLKRHDNALVWFTRKRQCGNLILHHRTIHPVLIREWSIEMEQYAGAIWQSQRTAKRFR